LASAGAAGLPSKKKTLRASERDRPDVKVRREAWRNQTREVGLRRLYFLDESGAKTNMTRLYGRSFAGQRVYNSVPQGHWATTTMLAIVGWFESCGYRYTIT